MFYNPRNCIYQKGYELIVYLQSRNDQDLTIFIIVILKDGSVLFSEYKQTWPKVNENMLPAEIHDAWSAAISPAGADGRERASAPGGR